MGYQFTPEQDAALSSLLKTTEYIDSSPTDETDSDLSLSALADALRGVSPWDKDFETTVTTALDAVKAVLAGDPRNEAYIDARENLESLLIINWGMAPEGLTAGAGTHWKDELRIPKGNGKKSGQWTFTPWKHLGILVDAIKAAEQAEPGLMVSPQWQNEMHAPISIASDILSNLNLSDPSPNDAKMKIASDIVGQLYLDMAVSTKHFNGIDKGPYEKAAQDTLAFGKYDWSLFDSKTDIGSNDPNEDFGELLTDEETDIGAVDDNLWVSSDTIDDYAHLDNNDLWNIVHSTDDAITGNQRAMAAEELYNRGLITEGEKIQWSKGPVYDALAEVQAAPEGTVVILDLGPGFENLKYTKVGENMWNGEGASVGNYTDSDIASSWHKKVATPGTGTNKKAKDLQAGDVILTYDENGEAYEAPLTDVSFSEDLNGNPQVDVSDSDGGSWSYGLEDDVEVVSTAQARPGAMVAAKDLKPGMVITDETIGPNPLTVEVAAPISNGMISVLPGAYKFPPDAQVTVLSDAEGDTLMESVTMTNKAGDLKVGDLFTKKGKVIGVAGVVEDEHDDGWGVTGIVIQGTDGSDYPFYSNEVIEGYVPGGAYAQGLMDDPNPTFKSVDDLSSGDSFYYDGKLVTINYIDENIDTDMREVNTTDGQVIELPPNTLVSVPGGTNTSPKTPAPSDEQVMKHKKASDVQVGDKILIDGEEVEVTAVNKQDDLTQIIGMTAANGEYSDVYTEDEEVEFFSLPGVVEVGDTVWGADGTAATVIDVSHGNPYGIKVVFPDGEESGWLTPSEYNTFNPKEPPPLEEWEIELLGAVEQPLAELPSKPAKDLKPGDKIKMYDYVVEVNKVITGSDPWGTGSPIVTVSSKGGQDYAFDINDEVILEEVAPEPPAPNATRADFLGLEPFTTEEKKAIQVYGMPYGYKTINPYLNNDGQVFDSSIPGLRPATVSEKEFALKTIADLDSAFKKAKPLEHEVSLIRSTDNYFGNDQMPPGTKFTNAAFMSTAMPGGQKHGYGYESKPVKWDVVLPKGFKALQGNAHENEILLPRGTEFEVVSDTTDASGIRSLKVRAVLPVDLDAPKEKGSRNKIRVEMPLAAHEIGPGDKLILDGQVLKKSGGKLVPSTGVAPTVAEIKVGPKWANVVTTTGQKLWIPQDALLTVQREVTPEVNTYPTTSLLPGDTLILDGEVLKKSAGKLVPAEAGKQGKHEDKPVIASVKHGPKWTEVVTTTGQKLWIASGVEVTAERTDGMEKAGAVTPATKGKKGKWTGKPAPIAPEEPVEPKAGVPKPHSFDEWLVKVKERYAANPNKAKATLEESANWPKVASVIGTDPKMAESGLASLLKQQYIDEDLKAEAEKIWADAAVVPPGEAEKYASDHAKWAQAMTLHEKILKEWQQDNPTSLLGMTGGKVFKSNSEGVAWANTNLKKPLSSAARAMVKKMKGSSSGINGKLWNNNGQVPPSIAQNVKDLDSAMSPLEHDIYLFRGTNMSEFKGIKSVEELKKAVGTTFVQHGYQPTGLGVDTHFSGSQVQIAYRAPKGTKGVWAMPVKPPDFEYEREFMLGRNTKYFIHKVTQKDGKIFVEAEIIPDHSSADPTGQPPNPLTTKVGTYFARYN